MLIIQSIKQGVDNSFLEILGLMNFVAIYSDRIPHNNFVAISTLLNMLILSVSTMISRDIYLMSVIQSTKQGANISFLEIPDLINFVGIYSNKTFHNNFVSILTFLNMLILSASTMISRDIYLMFIIQSTKQGANISFLEILDLINFVAIYNNRNPHNNFVAI